MTDMHDEAKVHKLQNELENVVVPQKDFGAKPSMIADIVLGTASEVFIGIQGSTESRNIGILREGFGKKRCFNELCLHGEDRDRQLDEFLSSSCI
jgi:hypothetical protein